MKIVFVIPDMPGGGTERVVSLLANEYAKRNIETAVLMFAGNQVEYKLDEHIEVISVASASDGSIRVVLRRIMNMRTYYKKNRNCHIFAFSTMGAVFSVIAAAGIPHTLLVSERSDPRKSPHRRWFEWAYAKADKVVLQTPDVLELFPKKIRKKAVIIPNPVDESIPARFTGHRRKVVTAVGRLERVKNYSLLIRAFRDFYQEFSDYQLHLYGIGELEQELKLLAKTEKIDHAVTFKGFSANVKEEIRDAGMYVLSSDYEGISNAMIEAIAMGVPTIATDCPIGGARMYIKEGVSGLLVPTGDRKRLADAMKRIASDRELAETLSLGGVKIKEKYGLQEIASRLLEE